MLLKTAIKHKYSLCCSICFNKQTSQETKPRFNGQHYGCRLFFSSLFLFYSCPKGTTPPFGQNSSWARSSDCSCGKSCGCYGANLKPRARCAGSWVSYLPETLSCWMLRNMLVYNTGHHCVAAEGTQCAPHPQLCEAGMDVD